MLTLKSLPEAEKFVRRQQRLGNDIRWDGWDIVFHRVSERGLTSKDGAFRNGKWGFENRSELTEEGRWNIDFRNVKRRTPRNRD